MEGFIQEKYQYRLVELVPSGGQISLKKDIYVNEKITKGINSFILFAWDLYVELANG